MTNTLHAFIDHILDDTLVHPLSTRRLPFTGLTDCGPARTRPGIVNALLLKAIRLLAGGEAKIGGKLASMILGAARLRFTEEVFLRVARIDLGISPGRRWPRANNRCRHR